MAWPLCLRPIYLQQHNHSDMGANLLLRRRKMMASVTSKPSLPTGYIELPYVSCNNSCIDTGLRGSYTQTINIKFLLSANSTYYGGIIGAVVFGRIPQKPGK